MGDVVSKQPANDAPSSPCHVPATAPDVTPYPKNDVIDSNPASDADDEPSDTSPPPSPQRRRGRVGPRHGQHVRVAQDPVTIDTGRGFCKHALPVILAEYLKHPQTLCLAVSFVLCAVFLLGFTLGHVVCMHGWLS